MGQKLPYSVELDRMARRFAEGVEQANRDARRGFWQVYLWVFVLVDSRLRNAGRLTYDGLDSYLCSRVGQTISTARLLPRVGLMKFEWVQAIASGCRRLIGLRSPTRRAALAWNDSRPLRSSRTT